MARNENEILKTIQTEKPHLVILDASLPGKGGLEMCRRLREDPVTAEILIIMVTEENDHEVKIQALETGADDCVAKPLQVEELIAHIRAVSRRSFSESAIGRLRAGPIDMDLERWTVSVAGTSVSLTKKEFCLLQALLEAKGRTLTRDLLLQKTSVHGTNRGLGTRTIDVHIGRLRRKLGPVGRHIITVRTVGFRFNTLPDWITRYYAQ